MGLGGVGIFILWSLLGTLVVTSLPGYTGYLRGSILAIAVLFMLTPIGLMFYFNRYPMMSGYILSWFVSYYMIGNVSGIFITPF